MLLALLQNQQPPASGIVTPPTTTALVVPAQVAMTITPQVMVGSGGSGGPYRFHATGLPPGLDLALDGTMSGTPTLDGVFPYTVFVVDSALSQGSIPASITVEVADVVIVIPVTGVDPQVGLRISDDGG